MIIKNTKLRNFFMFVSRHIGMAVRSIYYLVSVYSLIVIVAIILIAINITAIKQKNLDLHVYTGINKLLLSEHITNKKLIKENNLLKQKLFVVNKKQNSNIVVPDILINWVYKNSKKYIPKSDIISLVRETARYKTCYMLLAVFKEESGFDRYAHSSKGAKGLGQIRTSVWFKKLTKEHIWNKPIDAYDYKKNIAACNYILLSYRKEKGSWKKALYDYVNGNDGYVKRVLSNFAEISLLMNNSIGLHGLTINKKAR